MEEIEGKNYFTIGELMERLKTSRWTIQRYVYSGRLKAIKIRGRVLITEESYNSLLEPVPYVKKTKTPEV